MNAILAIPIDDHQIFQHFGQATTFKIYTIENDEIKNVERGETNGKEHEEVALWLLTHGVNAVICGNIGPGAQGALMAAGIVALAGVEGSADEAVAKLLDGTLEALQNLPNCGHHGHGGCSGHCGHGGGCGGCCHH